VRSTLAVLVTFAACASSCAGRADAVLAARSDPPPVTIEPEPAPDPVASRPVVAWAEALTPLRFVNTRTGVDHTVRLYTAFGDLDEDAAAAVDRVIAEKDAEPRPLDRRVLRLVVKAAAHFKVSEVNVVSTFRDSARKGSKHRSGEAMDFSFPGVTAQKLAAHLRTYARVGVGVYTHKRTQFVHLDVREQSYHWIDASPPGHVWREGRLTDRGAAARDAAYRPEQDLPG
jgi:uncharacterized protein YcbK (DUF882 family)